MTPVDVASNALGSALDTTPRAGRRSRRFTPDERRADIIRAATLLIASRGHYGVTVNAVAAACRMTSPGLRHYFSNKDDLLIAVLGNRDVADLKATGISGAEGYVSNPREHLDALVRRNSGQHEIVRLYTTLNSESISPEHPAHQYFADRYASSVAAIGRILRGHFPDPDRTAAQLIAIMDGIQLQWLRHLDTIDLIELWNPLADAVFATAIPVHRGA